MAHARRPQLRMVQIGKMLVFPALIAGLSILIASASPADAIVHAHEGLALLPLLSSSQLTSQHILLPFQRSDPDNPIPSLQLDWSPEGLVLADIDMDGAQEIIVCDERTSSLYLMGLSSVEVVDSGTTPWWPGFVSLAVGEFCGGAGDDIVVFYGPDTLVLLSQGQEGQLELQRTITADEPLGGIVVGDMNSDGRADLVTAIGILYQQPDCSFGTLEKYEDVAPVPQLETVDIAIGDFNTDGLQDVVRTVTQHAEYGPPPVEFPLPSDKSGIVLLTQQSDGRFSETYRYLQDAPRQAQLAGSPGPVGATTYAHIAVGNATCDKLEDLVVCVGSDVLLFAQADGDLTDPVPIAQLEFPRSPMIAPSTAEGQGGIVVCSGWDRIAHLALVDETWTAREFAVSLAQIPGPQAIAVGDPGGRAGGSVVGLANFGQGVFVLVSTKIGEPLGAEIGERASYWRDILLESPSAMLQGWACLELAALELAQGCPETGLELLQSCIESAQGNGQIYLEALARLVLGSQSFELGAHGAAFTAWEQSHVLFHGIGASVEERGSLLNLGLMSFLQGDYNASHESWAQCLEIDQRFGRRRDAAAALSNMALARSLQGQVSEALDTLDFAVAYLEVGEQPSLQAIPHGNRGFVLAGQGSLEEALSETLRALKLLDEASSTRPHSASDERYAWSLLVNAGTLSMAGERFEEALAYLMEAVGRIEQERGLLTREDLKVAHQQATSIAYQRLVACLCSRGRASDAFIAAERGRARAFLDLVAAGPVEILDAMAEEGMRTGVVDASVIEADLAEVMAGLAANTAALEYFVTNAATYLWLIRDGSVSNPIEIEIARSDLLGQVLAFRTSIETSSTGLSDAVDEDTSTMSRDLYELLITPVEDQLDGIDHLVIVPSGPLYYLPFCALLNCPDCEGADFFGGEYLIESYSLSYTPSLTTLKYAWASSDATCSNPLFVALADPDSGDPEIQRLPDAQDEAVSVAALFDPSEVYVDFAATEDVVSSRTSSADHLLLSTHGVFNPLNSMFSYLLLAPTNGSDGRLYTHEVFSLDLHTDLVTLSACETLLPALGDAEVQGRAIRGMSEEEPFELDESLLEMLTAGDEIVGLTRAFLYAGSSSVLSTLWRVVSETTEQLMVTFYGYMEGGMNKAEALRQAQLDIMAVYPHPRHWAAFNLVGDWEARFHPLPESMSKLSSQLLEKYEEWRTTESSESELLIVVMVILHEAVSEDLVERITSLSGSIELHGGFGHFVQLKLPFSLLPALSQLSEVEQITEQPAMSTTP